MKNKMRYKVIVGNVGTVYDGENEEKAHSTYAIYVEASRKGEGRAAGEPVGLMADSEVIAEILGTHEFINPEEKLTCKTAMAQWCGDRVVVWPTSGYGTPIQGTPLLDLPVEPADTLIERLVNESAERGYGIENVRDGKVWL